MKKTKDTRKRLLSLFMSATMILGSVSITPTVAAAEENYTVADWKFGQIGVKSGSIEDGDLVIADQSGNQNDLMMQLYKGKQLTEDTGAADWSKYLSFEDKTMNGSSDGSMKMSGNNSEGTGADFITVDNASINQNKFEDGYTIEFLYYFPEDWTAADQWMGLMARQVENTSNVKSMDEPEVGSTSIAVSNCKEIQFLTAPANDDEKMTSAAWSVSMDKGGVWYHIAITSDGNLIKTYVNGCEAFRDYASDGMDGMFADSADGRFRIGSSWWKEGSQTLDKFLKGNLQEVRISSKALEQSQWLIPNTEDYVGEFGNNESYTLEDESDYNFVLIPDTQNTVKFKEDIMDTAVKELIHTSDELNVAGVIHLGDIVENNNDGVQYDSAKSIFYQLPEAGIKFLAQAGNHDGWSAGISNYYNSFSKNSTLFMKKTASYLTNDSPSGNSSYMLVQAGSYNYLVISLSCSGSASGSNNNTTWDSADEAWFKQVLDTYPNCPTIVTTHDLQNCSDTMPNSIKLSNQGQKLWNIVKNYDQVFMMVGGHSHGSGVETLTNANGKPVISVLADYQFMYNGGNGFFKYMEFSENQNKIFLKTYSPYAASLSESEKTFFDVNFMTGDGNYNEVDLDFKTRFPGMEIQKETATEGKWLSGEYHTHTNQSNDTQVSESSVENMLDIAFREGNYTSISGASNITNGTGLDFIALCDHFRKSIADADGNFYASSKYMPRYIGIEQQIKKFDQLLAQGKYTDKILFSGFEWDAPGLDHMSVGIIDSDSEEIPTDAIHEFEWLYADQSNDPDNLYDDNGSWELENYGERKATTSDGGRSNVEVAYDALKWLQENYPDSYALVNHPSRHNGGSGEVTVSNLRIMNDIAKDIVFGFEGMPGNQLSPDETRSEMNDIYGGADVMLAKVGGIWDSMLGEGRHFYNFTNSDSHFKISGSNSSGYYPGEYSRNYVFTNPGEDGTFDFTDVVEGMRSGNSFAVYGDLINALEFTATSGNNTTVMGSDLIATTDDMVELTIRFKSPSNNNYEEYTEHETTVTNEVSVDHVDLISGEISGKLSTDEYDKETNETTTILKTFYEEDWGEPDEEGYYTVHYEVPADKDKYYRLRGTNLPAGTENYTDEQGNPLQDISYNKNIVPDFTTRVNALNDRNYMSLWFYSNPIFVYTSDSNDATLSDITLSTGTLSPKFESNIKNYSAEVPYEVDSIEIIPTATDSHATVYVQGVQVATGAAISLKVGNNDISVEVIAQDGTATSEYVVSIRRASENDPPVKFITLSDQRDTIMEGVAQSINYIATTTNITEGTEVTANWSNKSGNVVTAPVGLEISATPVQATGSSITVVIDETAVAGTYYFTVSSDGVKSSAASLTITASVITYTVNFVDWDGTILKTETVNEGESATAPENPTRAGYNFVGWDKTFSNVTSDLAIKAQYRSNSTGSGSDNNSSTSPSAPETSVENVQVDIKSGEQNDTLLQMLIERKTKEDGQKTDTVTYKKENAIDTVNMLKNRLEDTAKIVIPDDKNDVSETIINLSADAIDVLVEGKVNLQIEMQEAKLSISKESLEKINKETNYNVYFRVVPINDEERKDILINRATIKGNSINKNSKEDAHLAGIPVAITTNITSMGVDIALPISGEDLPLSKKERANYLEKLAVYVKHSDSEEELLQGEVVEVREGQYEMKFHIDKFSDFAVVNTDAFKKSSECKITKVTTPAKAVIKKQTITASVKDKSSLTVKVNVSKKASYKVYSNKSCTKLIAKNKVKLKEGVNKVYIKVTAQDGKTYKIYTLKITNKVTKTNK